MSVPVSISPYAQKAVTNLISECHLMEFCDADAERIVQNAIDEAVQEAVKRNSERIGGAGGGIMNDTALNWIMGPDTGVSSKTIWAFMMGVSLNSFVADVPYGPSDFGRCYRLLTLNPQWEARLPEMAEALPRWRPLIDSCGQAQQDTRGPTTAERGSADAAPSGCAQAPRSRALCDPTEQLQTGAQ